MKVEKKDLGKGKFKLTVTVSADDLLKYYKITYDNLVKDVKVSGFRPGKAPRKISEESVGVARLLSESLDAVIQQEYFNAITEEKMIPVCPPKVTISTYPNWGLEKSEIKTELVFEAEVEVMPEVTLKDYSKVRIEKREASKVTEEDVKKIIHHLQKQRANFSEIDREAKNGDRVEINYSGSIDKVKKDSMTAKNHPLILGENTLIPGFEENVVGMKKGDEKKFDITFPKDYHAKDFAGKKAEFEVKLVDLKEVTLPEVDDSFAEKFGHDNVANLTDAIRKSLKDEVEAKTRQELETEAIEKVLPFLSVEIPDGLVDQEVDRIVADMSASIESKGLKMDKYLESIKKTLPEMRKDLRPTADKNIRIGFLLGKIIESEKLDQSDPEAGRKALDHLVKKLTTNKI